MRVLVVAGCDAPEVLEPAEHTFDDVAVAVAFFIEDMEMFAVGLVGNDWFDLAPLQPRTPMVGVVSFVCQKETGVR